MAAARAAVARLVAALRRAVVLQGASGDVAVRAALVLSVVHPVVAAVRLVAWWVAAVASRVAFRVRVAAAVPKKRGLQKAFREPRGALIDGDLRYFKEKLFYPLPPPSAIPA